VAQRVFIYEAVQPDRSPPGETKLALANIVREYSKFVRATSVPARGPHSHHESGRRIL
jgi:hypothetical protein